MSGWGHERGWRNIAPAGPKCNSYCEEGGQGQLLLQWLAVHPLFPAVVLAAALLGGACGQPPQPAATEKEVVVWKKLGEWSGRGNAQTESFVGLTGSLRMRWRTQNEASAGQGTFRLILQSAISGRDLREAVDQKGPGEGTAYVAEDPRMFYMSVESANLDWSVTVEEAVFGSVSPRPGSQ